MGFPPDQGAPVLVRVVHGARLPSGDEHLLRNVAHVGACRAREGDEEPFWPVQFILDNLSVIDILCVSAVDKRRFVSTKSSAPLQSWSRPKWVGSTALPALPCDRRDAVAPAQGCGGQGSLVRGVIVSTTPPRACISPVFTGAAKENFTLRRVSAGGLPRSLRHPVSVLPGWLNGRCAPAGVIVVRRPLAIAGRCSSTAGWQR
jgi:hypothetical protein